MLKKYRNSLFESIQGMNKGLGNCQFQLEEKSGQIEIIVPDTPLKFIIIDCPHSFNVFKYNHSLFAPNFPLTGEIPAQANHYETFDKIINIIKKWLDDAVKPYIDEQDGIDMWREYKKGNKTLNIESINFDDKDSFSIDEKTQITLALSELKLLIEGKFQLSEKEMNIVNERLNYLIESKERLNKFDWKSLLINTIINITVALSLDTHKGQELFLLFKHAFAMIPQLGT